MSDHGPYSDSDNRFAAQDAALSCELRVFNKRVRRGSDFGQFKSRHSDCISIVYSPTTGISDSWPRITFLLL